MFARAWAVVVLSLAAISIPNARAQSPADPLAWPEETQTARPWTRWWWHGSAVDEANITRLLETYQAAGIGGVEITCIYGVRGAEDRELQYLSPEWIAAVRHALREAKRLNLGVDLPTGSGWRMGGPSVTEADANAQLVLRAEPVSSGTFERTFASGRPQALVAYGPDGQTIDLTPQINADGELKAELPNGAWTVYSLTQRWSRDNVKRPAPGGEGRNINPYSRRSLDHYLQHFANKVGDLPKDGIRAQFHDSFEYEGNWCDDFLAEFEKRRGYKLQDHLPKLDGKGEPEEIAKIKHDYRETLSDLVLDNLIKPWTDWSHANGMLARNQSHGSPANWLDLYAAVDIPETESFGRLVGGDGHPLMFKFASSAAHVAGRPLVSSETATWLDEHYHVTLGQIKEMVDRQFLAGVNHVLYHGTAYSPADAAWPGWVFYASTQLNPQNPIWRDLPALNAYVTRCQSMLQSTKPDNDVLLYWPIHDLWQDAGGLRMDLRVHNANEWLLGTPFGKVAQWLDDNGYMFDYISDRQIESLKVNDGRIQTAGGNYSVVIVPKAKYLPLVTMQKLVSLAESGAKVIFQDALPAGPPGLIRDKDRETWNSIASRIESQRPEGAAEFSANLGAGRITVAIDLQKHLDATGARREPYHKQAKPNLEIHRRSWKDGHVYLIRNRSDQGYGSYIGLGTDWDWAVLMDPLTGKTGIADVRESNLWGRRLIVPLDPGQTLFIKTMHGALPDNGRPWPYGELTFYAVTPLDKWSVEFVQGGPMLPGPTTIEGIKTSTETSEALSPRPLAATLESWTKFAGEAGERFAGTARYSTTFSAPAAGRYILDLGKVADSARVLVNGKAVVTLITAPYKVDFELSEGENRLDVEVTNVAANRIRDLDRRGVEWKVFKDINIVGINYRPLDASRWPVREAGLLGPVTLLRPTKLEQP